MVPYLTADLPGSGGAIKVQPEDFVVDEVPSYLPSGSGEHLFLHVKKRGVATPDAARRIARALGVDGREVSWAGLKDKQAVTTQWFSVPAKLAEPKVSSFADPEVQLLEAKRHGNKLKNGHLRANRFSLWIRGASHPEAARACFERLVKDGVPNAFGEQRFGGSHEGTGDNADKGKALLLGQRLPKKPDRFERKLYLSAFQSLLFNRALARRLQDGTLGRALLGDVLKKADTGGLFVCEDPGVDQPRVDNKEVSAAGPMFGPKMTKASHAVAEGEEALLREAGVTLTDFVRGGDETEGTRRPYRILLSEPSLEVQGADVHVSFVLPKGSYATVVLRELMKVEQTPGEAEEPGLGL